MKIPKIVYSEDFLNDKPFFKKNILTTIGGSKAAQHLLMICAEEYEKNKINYLSQSSKNIAYFNRICKRIEDCNLSKIDKIIILKVLRKEAIDTINKTKRLNEHVKIKSFTTNIIITRYKEALKKVNESI